MKKIALIAAGTTLGMTGCASVDMASKTESQVAKQLSAPDEGKAGVYVHREDTPVGAVLKKDVWNDSDCLGETAKGVCFYHQVEGDNEYILVTESEFSSNKEKRVDPFSHDQDENKFEFSIGAQAYHYAYEEPSLWMKLDGWMYGVSYALRYQLNPTWQVAFEGMYAEGGLDYTSEHWGTYDGKDNMMTDNRLILGYTLDQYSSVTPTLYTGFAYRYLLDEGEGLNSSTDDWFYDRHSHYYYSPIGVKLDFNNSGDWQVAATVEYDYFWHGVQKSDLAYAGYWDLKNPQHNGYGARLLLSFQKPLNDKYTLRIEPFFRYWSIKTSETVYKQYGGNTIRFIEPRNSTREAGLNLSLTL